MRRRPARPQPLATPFSETLRQAIRGANLSLKAISTRLFDEDDVSVSVSTLSNWRNGRPPQRSPDRDELIYALERVLGLRRGELLLLLEKDQHRRVFAEPTVAAPRNSTADQEIGPLRDHVNRLGRVTGYITTTVEERLVIGSDRKPRQRVVRQTVLAVGDHTDCYWLFYSLDDNGASVKIQPLAGCRLGRHVPWGDRAATELLFDRTLKRGQSHTFTFQLLLRHPVQPPALSRRWTGHPTLEELDMTVRFETPPRLVWKCEWPQRGEESIDRGPVDLVDGAAHLLLTHPIPGMYGLRWKW